MFTYILDEDTELRPLEPAHARHIYQLIDQSRSYLRQWLSWVDATTRYRRAKITFVPH
ncbi:hypothetical protein [Paenibacillus bovis]|uniref:hypothetical protein n=1 Tax=Paenibacillus bovis TaxID=1616788 RepID=UPI000A72AB21|nr:hypothetical protein [Paenibacillus bovis]